MPTLSMFYGIIVRMYAEHGGKHSLPHIHAEYQGQKIVVSLDGNVLEGEFPAARLHMLLAWMDIHKDALLADWDLLSAGEPYFKIEPLR